MNHYKINQQLQLSSLCLEDAETIWQLVHLNKCMLGNYLPWVSSVTDVATARDYIKARIDSGLAGASWYKILFYQKHEWHVAGVFAVKQINSCNNAAELGYWLGASFQKQGIIRQIIDWMLKRDDNPFSAIELRILEGNKASLAIAHAIKAEFSHVASTVIMDDGSSQRLLIYVKSL